MRRAQRENRTETINNRPAEASLPQRRAWALLFVVVVSGILLRYLAAAGGHNYDFDSFRIVVGIVEAGGNVYANTARYNYGPIWLHLLHALFAISAKDEEMFRYALITTLITVDLLIFTILHRVKGRPAAYIFFLSPISIIITGYHNQFDNLALLAGMLAVMIIGDDFDAPLNKRKFLGLIVLGLSLSIKHILFAFPIWLAAKQKGVLQKVGTVVVPVLVFAAGFLPYWKEGHAGIVSNVFLYKSFNNEVLFRLLVPDPILPALSSTVLWAAVLLLGAVPFRKRKTFESLLLYSCILVAASPSVANQYLAIPIAYTAANPNLFTIAYNLIGGFFLLLDSNGLHLQALRDLIPLAEPHMFFYPFLVFLLSAGFVLAISSNHFPAIREKLHRDSARKGNPAKG